jgi:hypothetical protein
MAQRRACSVLAFVPLLTSLAAATPAAARVDGNSGYSKTQTYSGALRYVRVDLGYEVVEKDPDAAYLIFKYTVPGGSKNSPATGTLEVIEAQGGVRLFVSLPRMPEYHERIFRDGLLKKLREEYGAPPAAAKKPPPPTDKPAPAPGAPDGPATP